VSALTNSDTILIPFHGKHASSLLIEVRSVGGSAPFCDTAACVLVDMCVALDCGSSRFDLEKRGKEYNTWTRRDLIIAHRNIAREAFFCVKNAAGFCVPCNLVMFVVVDTFNDIDLAAL
jgi:hypothetical protein